MSLLVDTVVFVGAAVGAAYAHELTHYVVARAVGLDAVINPVSLDLITSDEELPVWQDAAIGLAPLVVGVVMAVVYTTTQGFEAVVRVSTPVVLAWTIYTVLGGARDFQAVTQTIRGGEPA